MKPILWSQPICSPAREIGAFPGVASRKEPGAANAGDVRDVGSISGSGRSPGGGHGNPVQYSCLENPVDRAAWWAIVTGLQRVEHDWSDLTHTGEVRHTCHYGIAIAGYGKYLSKMLWEHQKGRDLFQPEGRVGWWKRIGQGRGDMWDLRGLVKTKTLMFSWRKYLSYTYFICHLAFIFILSRVSCFLVSKILKSKSQRFTSLQLLLRHATDGDLEVIP